MGQTGQTPTGSAGRRVDAPYARWLLRISPRTGSLGAVGAAAGVLAACILIRIPLDTLAKEPLPPYITIYPLLPLIGFVCGLRVGVASIVTALALGWYLWVGPVGSAAMSGSRTGVTVLIFAVAGPIVIAFGALARHALEGLADQQATSDRNAREAVHRIKNVLAAVSAIVRGEARSTSDAGELAARIQETIAAMARAQDLLVNSGDLPTSLSSVVEAGMATCGGNPRLHVAGGADIALPKADFTGLVLALHELCTNSFKYGVLGSEAGRIEVKWVEAGNRAELHWIETGVQVQDAKDGFGSRLIRGALVKIPGGVVTYQRRDGEVRCDFAWPNA